jgi:hypothetical protein
MGYCTCDGKADCGYRDIEQEARLLIEKQEGTVGRQLMDAVNESNEILECYRQIGSHFKRLKVSLGVVMMAS